MKSKQNLIVSLVFFALFLFEIIVFIDILSHPYMVILMLFLIFVGAYHFGVFVAKELNKINKRYEK